MLVDRGDLLLQQGGIGQLLPAHREDAKPELDAGGFCRRDCGITPCQGSEPLALKRLGPARCRRQAPRCSRGRAEQGIAAIAEGMPFMMAPTHHQLRHGECIEEREWPAVAEHIKEAVAAGPKDHQVGLVADGDRDRE